MIRTLPLFIAALLAFFTTIGHAGEFSVTPIRLDLNGAARSQLLAITNTGNAPARFLVRSAGWTVTEAGAVELSDNDQLIVFPASFTVAPKATQNIRAGTDQAPRDTEQTWRIVLEELPDPSPAGSSSTTINVLSVLSVPVFMPPVSVRKSIQASLKSIAATTATITISNSGNVHELISAVSLTAMRGSDIVAQSQVEGWYLLPGAQRTFKVTTAKNWCSPGLTGFEMRTVDREGQVLAKQTIDASEACR